MSFSRIRLLTAGESHGPAQSGVLEGLPAHVPISREELQRQMKRRQMGHGRGGRMKIETDEIEITAGLRGGRTLGSPIAYLIRNRDFQAWQEVMPVWDRPRDGARVVTCPRPGHADLAGGLKYDEHDLRNILERASARETVARTAAGMICRQMLELLGIRVASHVVALGRVSAADPDPAWEAIEAVQESDMLRCVDPAVEQKMIAEVDQAGKSKDTLGGIVQVVARGILPGIGSHVHWDRRLDGRIAHALMSIPSAKGVELGHAFQVAQQWGGASQDEIHFEAGKGFFRNTNHAGGTEGGITTGQELRIRVAFKPLSTLMHPLQSVNVVTKQPESAQVERSDVCAVPAGGVVAEAMLCLVLADALLEQFSSDTLQDLQASLDAYRRRLDQY